MPNPLSSISVNQQKQYGDQKILDTAKVTKQGAVSGAVMPARKAGRPVQNGQSAQSQGQGSYSVPPEHQALAQRVARSQAVRDYWAGVAQNFPSAWSRMYASAAEKDLQEAALEARKQTPWFEI